MCYVNRPVLSAAGSSLSSKRTAAIRRVQRSVIFYVQSSPPPAPPGYRYQLCLSRSDAETLQQFVDDHFEREGLKGCMLARMEVEEGRLSVTRSCPSRYGTMDMRLSARLSADAIEGVMLAAIDMDNARGEARYLLNGRRIGECPPSRPEGAAGRD